MRNNRNISLIISVLFILFGNLCCFAQKDVTFKLSRADSGHYMFPVMLNGEVKASALLESGIHAMLLDSAFAFENHEKLGVEFLPCDEKMNLGGRKYRISHKANATLQLGGGVCYKGEVFLLSGFAGQHEAALPVQNLYSANGRRIIKLDLEGECLQLLCEYNAPGKEWSALEMNSETYMNMPAVESEMIFRGVGYVASLKGNFNIDLGNASMLFLFKHRKTVQDFLDDNPKIELQKGYDRKGNVVAEAFVPDVFAVGGMRFSSPTIAITGALPKFTTEGCLGIKYFRRVIALFDFDNNVCYMRER